MIWNVDRAGVGLSSDQGGLSLPGGELSTRILELPTSKLIIVLPGLLLSNVRGGQDHYTGLNNNNNWKRKLNKF